MSEFFRGRSSDSAGSDLVAGLPRRERVQCHRRLSYLLTAAGQFRIHTGFPIHSPWRDLGIRQLYVGWFAEASTNGCGNSAGTLRLHKMYFLILPPLFAFLRQSTSSFAPLYRTPSECPLSALALVSPTRGRNDTRDTPCIVTVRSMHRETGGVEPKIPACRVRIPPPAPEFGELRVSFENGFETIRNEP